MRTALICMSILAAGCGTPEPALAGATSANGPLPAMTAAVEAPAQPGRMAGAAPLDTLELSWQPTRAATTHPAAAMKLSSAPGCGPATADWLELTVLERGS